MKKILYLFLCFIFTIISFTFSACSGEINLTCLGEITFNNTAMEGVVIKSDDRAFCVTDKNGMFTFKSDLKGIKIYPEKDGYYFEPAFAVLTEGENTCNFEAKKITVLNGTLILSKVIIKPTYIVSYSDNYLYKNDDRDCLKVFDISLNYSGQIYTLSNEDMFLYKNENNEIIVQDEIEIACGTQAQIGFLINTYFKYNYNESHTTYTEYSYLLISEEQTNNKLINNQITYNLSGINGKSNKFTFDITFVFNYIESTNELV